MTRWIRLDLHLRQDVVQSSDASSEGPHRSLDYIRGSNLLGVVAGRAYAALERRGLSYTAFHSGRVRFLDAQHCEGDALAWPVPYGWLAPKQSRITVSLDGVEHLDGRVVYAAPCLRDGQAAEFELQQVRAGHFTADGRFGDLSMPYRLKTAIDRTRHGAPQQSALFGYAALPAGRRMRAWIELDDDVDEAIDEAIIRSFDRGHIWVGRSRGAEYGRVDVEVTPGAAGVHADFGSPPCGATARPVRASRVAFMALSDLALTDDRSGLASVVPRPGDFGLDAEHWVLDPMRSAILVGRGSPFNGKRRRRDLARPVILRRSVLTFRSAGESAPTIDWGRIDAAVGRGVGRHRAEGMGQVLVHPWFLAEETLARFFPPGEIGAASPSESAGGVVREALAPPGELARWMLERARIQAAEGLALTRARETANKLLAFAECLPDDRPRPTRTQWNRLAHRVRTLLGTPITEAVLALANELVGVGVEHGGQARLEMWRASAQGRTLGEETLRLGLGFDRQPGRDGASGPAGLDLLRNIMAAPTSSVGPLGTVDGVDRLVLLSLTAQWVARGLSKYREETSNG